MFFLRMCTYLYLYLFLYDDETYLRPTGNSLIYSGRGASGDRTRRGPLCQRVGQVTPPKTGKAWMAWIHLDPSGSIVHLGLKVGEPWEINGKSMGNQWEITLEVSKMIRRTMKSHSHYSLGRSPMEKSPTVAGSTEFLGSEVRCLPARGSGVAMASHGGSWIGTRRGGVSGRILGAQAEGDEPLGPLTLRTWIRFIWLWINTY